VSGIRVGTASWTDRTLTQETDWYPKKSMSAEERLRFYASIFSMVEVDATYYYPPTEDLAVKWLSRSPDDFVFNVKAYSLLTYHPTRPDSLWPDVAEAIGEEHRGKKSAYLAHLSADAVDAAFEHFRHALMPLHSAGKLGAVFCQFPPWFTNNAVNRRYLDALPGRLPDFQLAVEFRHRSWLDGDSAHKTLDQLENLGLAYVCVDMPQGFESSVPPLTASTADLAVVRFHGHNASNWERRGITTAERFEYFYEDAELQTWVDPVRELAGQARETHVVFNNCYRDYGVRNARQMGVLLGEGVQTLV
jgi:uncharacterized protein YecE (DUF72 family)